MASSIARTSPGQPELGEVRQYAKQLGVREIRFHDQSPEGIGWDVLISEDATPPAA